MSMGQSTTCTRNSTNPSGIYDVISCTDSFYQFILNIKTGKGGIFSSKYKTTKLVYYEEDGYIYNAIDREKEIKGWIRKKKEALINEDNPLWEDLAKDWHEDL